MSKNTVDVTDATFSTDVLQSDKTVLVDFWAEWCGPCKMVAPVLEEIAGENKDTLTVAKLDIDRNPDAMRKYKIMAVPTWPRTNSLRGSCPIATNMPVTSSVDSSPVFVSRSRKPVTDPSPSTSVTVALVRHAIFGSFLARSIMIFEARKSSRRCTTVTERAKRVRKVASSIAESPPPTTAIS